MSSKDIGIKKLEEVIKNLEKEIQKLQKRPKCPICPKCPKCPKCDECLNVSTKTYENPIEEESDDLERMKRKAEEYLGTNWDGSVDKNADWSRIDLPGKL